MKAAFSKAELEAEYASRFGDAFRIQKRLLSKHCLPCREIDALRAAAAWAISEIFGPASSGEPA
jgi:hypothetical protein